MIDDVWFRVSASCTYQPYPHVWTDSISSGLVHPSPIIDQESNTSAYVFEPLLESGGAPVNSRKMRIMFLRRLAGKW
jgi:hypothetical protein